MYEDCDEDLITLATQNDLLDLLECEGEPYTPGGGGGSGSGSGSVGRDGINVGIGIGTGVGKSTTLLL